MRKSYQIVSSKQYKKDYKSISKSGRFDLKKLDWVINRIAGGLNLPPVHKNHRLKGDLGNFFECHIEPDWLLIYEIHEDLLILHLHRTGSHSKLF